MARTATVRNGGSNHEKLTRDTGWQPELGMAIRRLREVCGDSILERIDAFGREMLRDAIYQEV